MAEDLNVIPSPEIGLRTKVINAINAERNRQNKKWGVQRHDLPTWYTILGEEFGEVGQAMQKGSVAYKSSDADDVYKELIQVAAVAAAIAEQVMENET